VSVGEWPLVGREAELAALDGLVGGGAKSVCSAAPPAWASRAWWSSPLRELAGTRAGGELDIAVRGTDNTVWRKWWGV
jgi:hypothetical protein